MKTCEELLTELVRCFYIDGNGDLQWSYEDGYSVGEAISLEFQLELLDRYTPLLEDLG